MLCEKLESTDGRKMLLKSGSSFCLTLKAFHAVYQPSWKYKLYIWEMNQAWCEKDYETDSVMQLLICAIDCAWGKAMQPDLFDRVNDIQGVLYQS